jgi:LuxR family maltose regulon positive regulatory protein
LIEAEAEAVINRNESATVQRWLNGLPPELITARASLSLIRAVIAKITGHMEDVQPLLDQAETALGRSADGLATTESSARYGLTNVAAMLPFQRAELALRRGDPESVIAYSRAAEAATDAEDHYLQFVMRWERAMAALLQGSVVQVDGSMADIAVERLSRGDLYSGIYACYVRAQAQRARGWLHAATRTCEHVIAQVQEMYPGGPAPAVGIARVGLAEVLLEQGRSDTALEHAAAASADCQQLMYARWQVTGLAVLARVLRVRGEHAEARRRLDQARALLSDPEAWTDLANPLAVEQARLAMDLGDMAGLERWLERRHIREDAEPSFKEEREYSLLARSLIARGEPSRALALLQRMRDVAMSQERGGSVREIRTLEAVAFDMLGEPSHALAALRDALAMAEPEEHVRIFIDAGPRTRTLLEKLMPRQDGTFLRRVHGILSGRHPTQTSASNPRTGSVVLVDPLSQREIEVLGLLAVGMSNQQIAEELVVSVDTVKKHVSHILGKLDSASRTQAVARARELAIL